MIKEKAGTLTTGDRQIKNKKERLVVMAWLLPVFSFTFIFVIPFLVLIVKL